MYEQHDHPKPLMGTLELALFLSKGVTRFPRSKNAAILSFIVPITLMLIWVYPTSIVPTEVMGDRSYFDILLIHISIMTLHLGLFYSALWFILSYLKYAEKFCTLICIGNFISLVSFVLIMPLCIMVVKGAYSWEEIYGALIVISCYELAICAFAITKLLEVPWQFGAGIAFLSVFIWHGVSTSIHTFLGI
jgi:hypothetical protein